MTNTYNIHKIELYFVRKWLYHNFRFTEQIGINIIIKSSVINMV